MAGGFYGEYQNKMDVKGRVFVPVKFRDRLGSGFIAAAMFDNCVSLYPTEEWERMQERFSEMPFTKGRGIQRTIFSRAEDVEVDAQGRILLSKKLIAYGGLEREVTIIGAGGHAEIWNPERLAAYESTMTDEMLEAQLEELGF